DPRFARREATDPMTLQFDVALEVPARVVLPGLQTLSELGLRHMVFGFRRHKVTATRSLGVIHNHFRCARAFLLALLRHLDRESPRREARAGRSAGWDRARRGAWQAGQRGSQRQTACPMARRMV